METSKNLRQVFVEQLSILARQDKYVILIMGDVGYSFFESFQQEFPEQCLNCGVMEQTMMGMAAGMALSGFKPYVYTMVPFAIMRPYEQLRDDVCYNKVNVKIFGVKGSVHYKFLGMSHNLMGKENEEDLLKNLPNLKRYYPETEQELIKIMQRSYKNKLPFYVRI